MKMNHSNFKNLLLLLSLLVLLAISTIVFFKDINIRLILLITIFLEMKLAILLYQNR